MTQPYFSIIIPTYNSAKTLRKCLESILNQSFQSFEVLVVDGGSCDDTLSILKNYTKLFPDIYCISEKDKGIYDAMNKGIKMAKGEWMYFLGSDDLIKDNDVLEKVYSMDKSEHYVVYGNAKIIGNTAWAKDGDVYDGKFDLQKLLKKNICQQAMFYHKSSFTNNTSLFNIDYEICADWDFNLKCWSKKEFLFIDLTIVEFHCGGASTQMNANQEFYDDFDKNISLYFGAAAKGLSEMIPTQHSPSLLENTFVSTRNWLKNKFRNNPLILL